MPSRSPENVTLGKMDTEQVVALLTAERDRLSRAIEALQGPAKRRGRLPGPGKKPVVAVTAPSAPAPKRAKRRMSAAGRKAIAEAARRRWALIKAGKAKSPFAKAAKKKA
jgi:hypothetical protein